MYFLLLHKVLESTDKYCIYLNIYIHTNTERLYKHMYEKRELTQGLKAGLSGNTGLVSGQGCLLSPGLGLRALGRSPPNSCRTESVLLLSFWGCCRKLLMPPIALLCPEIISKNLGFGFI